MMKQEPNVDGMPMKQEPNVDSMTMKQEPNVIQPNIV